MKHVSTNHNLTHETNQTHVGEVRLIFIDVMNWVGLQNFQPNKPGLG